MEEKLAVSYCRVSTKKQSKSGKDFGQGLGLTDQNQRNDFYMKNNNYSCLAKFTEVESGKNPDRPEIAKAIKLCKEMDAILIVATLDRLARDLPFILRLRDTKVKFVIVDMPDANELTIIFLAAIAEYELKKIRERTTRGIRQSPIFKEGKWGNPKNFNNEGRQSGADKNKKDANEFWNTRKNYLQTLRKQRKTYAEIAAILNNDGYISRNGKKLHAMTVKRQFNRMGID